LVFPILFSLFFGTAPNSAFAYYVELVDPGNPSVIYNWLGMRYVPGVIDIANPGHFAIDPQLMIGLISDDGPPLPTGFTKIATRTIQENEFLDLTSIFNTAIFQNTGGTILGGGADNLGWHVVTTAFIPEPHIVSFPV
jgi:hypothetical protein